MTEKFNDQWIAGAMKIKSQVSLPELKLLFELASKVEDGCIVEIGSYHGRSTVALCNGAIQGNKPAVFAIEPHEEFEGIYGGTFGPNDRVKFFSNMLINNCAEYVRLINLKSEVVSKGWEMKVSLLWIDGDHSVEGVTKDFELWEHHLSDKARIVFHDSVDKSAGPYILISRLIEKGHYRIESKVDLITVLTKAI